MLKNKWFIKTVRAILLGGVSSFVFCPSCFSDPLENNIKVLLYYIITFFVIYEMMEFGVKIFNKKYNWIKQPYKMLLANTTLIAFVFLPLNYIAVEVNFNSLPRFSSSQIYFLKLNNLFTALLILLYINSKYFFTFWEKSVIKTQEISKQQIKYELLALKNQINPHFLFNNLNTLIHLVSEKHPEAEEYVLQLSNIYRYLLEEKKADIVAIEKEFKMIESLIYLLKIKYDDSIQFIYKLEEFKDFQIATFTLQLLIENAVKHNVITEENNLKIFLFLEENYLVVKNNILKTPTNVYTSGIGLNNIKNRYNLLSEKTLQIKEDNNYFIVKIPIIDYEDTNS